MSRILSFEAARQRRANAGKAYRLEATHAQRRSDGALVIGLDPSRHMVSAGLLLVIALVAAMWWTQNFRGLGPVLLLGLLGVLAAALVVPPSRLEIDREAGRLTLFSYRIGQFARPVFDTDSVSEVTLAELQRPDAPDLAQVQAEIVIRFTTGATITIEEPRSAFGHADVGHLQAICATIRQELSAEASSPSVAGP